VTATDLHGRALRIFTRIQQPVFANARHLEIEFYVAHKVLVGIVKGKHFDHEHGTNVLPANVSEREMEGKIVVRRDVRLWVSNARSSGNEHPGSPVNEVDDVGTFLGIVLELETDPTIHQSLGGRSVGETRRVFHQ
jgi:hypothetical protein